MITLNGQDSGTAQQDAQDPKPQDPKPQQPQAQQPAATPDAAPASTAQEPKAAQIGDLPSPDFEDKLARLVKARADALEMGLVDDRGQVLREPMSKEDALRNAMEYLPRYLQSDFGADHLRSYMANRPIEMAGGKKMELPNGWVPSTGTVPSQQTQELEWRAKVGREQNPGLAALNDYVVDPLNRIGPAFLQVPMDVAVGGLKAVGVAPPGARFDVAAKMGSAFSYLTGNGQDEQSTRDQLDAIANTKTGLAKVEQKGAEFVGMATGFATGGVGKILGVGGKAGEAVGKSLFGKLGMEAAGKAIGHGAGSFAAYEAIVADPGKRLEGAAHGAMAGAIMGGLQKAVTVGLRSMFRAPMSSLGPDEKAAMEALKSWAIENKVVAMKNETPLAYEKRVVDSWIAEGLPGAPNMPVRKLIGASMRGGADAFGFSMLDQQFRQDFIDAAWHGDTKKWGNVMTTFAGNFLGAAALNMPLKSIVPWQRKQSVTEARPQEPIAREIPPQDLPKSGTIDAAPLPESGIVDVPFSVQPNEPLLLPAPKETRFDKLSREQEAAVEQEYMDRWESAINGGFLDRDWLLSQWGGAIDNAIPLGWKPSEKSVRPRPEPTYFKDAASREFAREQAKKFEKDVQVKVGANAAQNVAQWFPENSQTRKQIDALGGAAGSITVPAKEAAKFVDYYARRADRKREEVGQPSLQSVDSFVKSLLEAHGLPTAPERATPVRGPEGENPMAPIGELRTGDAPATPEMRDAALEGKRIKIELAQSGHSFSIEGDMARPSPALREALGVPSEMPAKDLIEAVDKASLISALRAKAELPGEEISIGIRATPGRGDEPGVMRRVVMGKLQESVLRPDPQWKDAESAPARGKDALDIVQDSVVKALRVLNEKRDDIAPPERAMLNAAIEVLDTVAARNDQAVADTLAAAPQLVEAIAKGEPGAEKALAESLTTKPPERALNSLKKSREQKQDAQIAAMQESAKAKRATDPVEVAYDKSLEDFRAASRDFNAATKQYRNQEIGDAEFLAAREKFNAAKVVADRAEIAYIEAKNKKPNRSGESGFLDIGAAMDAANKAIDAIRDGAVGVAKNALLKPLEYFQRSQIQRVEDLGMPDLAEKGRDMVTASKGLQTRYDTSGLIDLRRTDRKVLDSFGELVRDSNGGYADVYQRAMDAATARHWGSVALTEAQQKVAQLGRAVHQEIARSAEEIGIEQTDHNGKNPRPFKAGEGEGRQVLVRQPTAEWAEAMRTQKGPLWEAFVGWAEGALKWTPQETAKQFSTAERLTALDATEVRRAVPFMPGFLDVAGRSAPTRLYETRPLEHAERLATQASNILGMRSEIPRFEPKDGEKEYPTPVGLDPLPEAAQQIANRVLTKKGEEAADAVARMLRAQAGLPLTPTPRIFRPGEPGYNVGRFFSNLASIAKASALTMSAAKNVAEPVQNEPFLGAKTIAESYAETAKAVAEGAFADRHADLVAKGFIADTKVNPPIRGDNAAETIDYAMQRVTQALLSPMRMSQDFNELVLAGAAEKRLEAMKAGEGNAADANALSLLGFKPEQVDAMLKGNGTAEQYDRYQRNIVGTLAGGKSLRGSEKSDAAHSRTFNSMVWFSGYFQMRTRIAKQIVTNFTAPNQTGEARAQAAGQLLRLAAMTTAGGFAGNALTQWILGGNDGLSDYVREQIQTDSYAENLAGLLFSGILGGMGDPVAQAWTALAQPGDVGGEIGNTVLRTLAPIGKAVEVGRFIAALSGVDVPGYQGMTKLQVAGKYVRNVMPAARAVHEGLFGLSALAITDKNIELDNAQDSYYRWARENRPEGLGRSNAAEEGRAWRDSMRRVMDQAMAGKTWDDDSLVAAVVEAQSAKMQQILTKQDETRAQGGRSNVSPYEAYKQARAAVAASLRSRKMLPEPGSMPTAQMESLMAHLGDKNVQTLRDFDAVLDLLAKRISSANLRQQAAPK